MKVELLSPAGNLEKLKVALKYGADAVYIGGKSFSLRERADNFTIDEMGKGIELAHSTGKRVYIAVNIFSRNSDIGRIRDFIKSVSEFKPDAFIVSDLGVLSIVKETAPDIDIHVSTQANVTNYLSAKVYRDMGASRVVLARELSLEEIRQIRENVPDLELEVFVHGAMCMAYSGRCLLSNYLTGRESNRGACAQSCRWKYYLVEEKRPGVYIPVEEDGRGTYIMNSKDICALPLLDELVDAGVNSVKIEGRVKSAYYVAVTTAVYRRALKLIYEDREKFRKELPELLEELEKVSHREYSTGFLKGNSNLQVYGSSSYIRKYRFLAMLKGDTWSVKNRFKRGDNVEIFTPEGKAVKSTVESIEREKDGIFEIADVVNPNDRVKIKFKKPLNVSEWSILRKSLT